MVKIPAISCTRITLAPYVYYWHPKDGIIYEMSGREARQCIFVYNIHVSKRERATLYILQALGSVTVRGYIHVHVKVVALYTL